MGYLLFAFTVVIIILFVYTKLTIFYFANNMSLTHTRKFGNLLLIEYDMCNHLLNTSDHTS